MAPFHRPRSRPSLQGMPVKQQLCRYSLVSLPMMGSIGRDHGFNAIAMPSAEAGSRTATCQRL